MTSLPELVRYSIKEKLWLLADKIDWMSLQGPKKSHLYDEWVRSPEIGGVLSRYIDQAQVRVYLKDTLMKDYPRARLADSGRVLKILGIISGEGASQIYIKPHGMRLADGRVFSWGRAQEWKSIVMSIHERTFGQKTALAFAVVLSDASGKFHQPKTRQMVESAARKLGIGRVVWLDA